MIETRILIHNAIAQFKSSLYPSKYLITIAVKKVETNKTGNTKINTYHIILLKYLNFDENPGSKITTGTSNPNNP